MGLGDIKRERQNTIRNMRLTFIMFWGFVSIRKLKSTKKAPPQIKATTWDGARDDKPVIRCMVFLGQLIYKSSTSRWLWKNECKQISQETVLTPERVHRTDF